MHTTNETHPAPGDHQCAPVTSPTFASGDRAAWSTPRLTPLLLGRTQAGGAGAADGSGSALGGSI
ncbi:MAG TPA: hypothetical protein VF755_01785 [Catenuloplanes sp.]